jgi:hypothetical protein
MALDLFMPQAAQREKDPWPEEREGYHQPRPVAYLPVRLAPSAGKESTAICRAEQIGSLVAGGGVIWTTYAVAHHSAEIARFAIFSPGPLEVLGVGVLIWLIAKWCRAVNVH